MTFSPRVNLGIVYKCQFYYGAVIEAFTVGEGVVGSSSIDSETNALGTIFRANANLGVSLESRIDRLISFNARLNKDVQLL